MWVGVARSTEICKCCSNNQVPEFTDAEKCIALISKAWHKDLYRPRQLTSHSAELCYRNSQDPTPSTKTVISVVLDTDSRLEAISYYRGSTWFSSVSPNEYRVVTTSSHIPKLHWGVWTRCMYEVGERGFLVMQCYGHTQVAPLLLQQESNYCVRRLGNWISS